jgi:hypothetical protein
MTLNVTADENASFRYLSTRGEDVGVRRHFPESLLPQAILQRKFLIRCCPPSMRPALYITKSPAANPFVFLSVLV